MSSTAPSTPSPSLQTSLQNWGEILRTQNLSAGRPMDAVSRWLLIIRASVFPMTIFSALIGGLLAVGTPGADLGLFALSLVGLIAAHAANNMINDYFDLEGGVDSEDYVRAHYAPHPVLSGLISKRGLLAAIAAVNLLDLAILAWLVSARGWGVAAFALAGLFVSVFYVAPPLRLKHHGLGEPGVFVVWGPLMIGGSYLATSGEFAPWVLLASLPYALLVTCVLMGKHIDKLDADSSKGIHTLPVLMGRERALAATRAMFIAFFAMIPLLVIAGVLTVWTLLAMLALPKLQRVLGVYRQPPPAEPPPNYPIWPLWYVSWAFVINRSAGALFVTGLALGALFPLSL